jgi:hypothetical protein
MPISTKSIDSEQLIQRSTEMVVNRSKTLENPIERRSIASTPSLNVSTTTLNKTRDLENRPEVRSSKSLSISTFENEPMKKEEYTIETWITKGGPLKLRESLNKLNLDLETISKINLASFSYDDLNKEKKNVKNELKNYDNTFISIFKRPPNREEKEPMRPLYIYYKKLKQYIAKVAEKGGQNSNTTPSTTVTSANTSTVTTTSIGSEKNKYEKPVSSTSANSYQRMNVPERRMDSSFEYNLSRDNSRDRMQSQQNVPKLNLKQGASGSNMDQLRKQLEELKQVRSQLKEKLHNYQVEFQRNNNRKIKYHKDIAPVEHEYKKYKEIKQEILRLEGILGL